MVEGFYNRTTISPQLRKYIRATYLFIYFGHAVNQAVIPKGYVAKRRKQRERRAHCRPLAGQFQQMESVALHSALCASLGGRSTPIQNNRRKEKECENNLAFAPRGYPISRSSRLPSYPLIHPCGVSRFHVRPISHRLSHPRQF